MDTTTMANIMVSGKVWFGMLGKELRIPWSSLRWKLSLNGFSIEFCFSWQSRNLSKKNVMWHILALLFSFNKKPLRLTWLVRKWTDKLLVAVRKVSTFWTNIRNSCNFQCFWNGPFVFLKKGFLSHFSQNVLKNLSVNLD